MEKRGKSKIPLLLIGALGIVAVVAIIGLGLGLGLPAETNTNACKESVSNGQDQKTTMAPSGTTTTIAPRRTTIDGVVEIPVDGNSSRLGKYRYAGVASDSEICSSIGSDIMAIDGGSAVDAAIATLLCVGVANSHSTGIGGGHFMTVYIRENQTSVTFMAREMAPANATENMYQNVSSTIGGLAIGVPGEIKGMYEAHRKFGKVDWKKLFQPTIRLCEEGIPLSKATYIAIESLKGRDYWLSDEMLSLRQLLTNPETRETYKLGEKIKRPELAQTLRVIAEEGPQAYYNGSLTADIVQDIQDAGGIITQDDLNNFIASVEAPVTFELNGGSTMYTPRPPSSGLVLIYILNILNGYNFTADDMETTEKKVLTFHRIIEAFKFAYAKRTNLGDEDFLPDLKEIITNLTSKEFGESIRAQITDDFTHTNYTYYGPTFFLKFDPVGTAHLSVLAPNGDAVSVTSTVNLYFGSKVVGSRTGIIFNDEMDDFSTPGKTNSFGVPASPANFIKPGKRPLSSMCPTIFVDKNGDVDLVVGASGGTQITTTVAWVALQTLLFGEDIRTAIDSARFHHQLIPGYVRYDSALSEEIITGLRAKKHDMRPMGVASTCQGILQQGGSIYACSDRRKGGIPDGY